MVAAAGIAAAPAVAATPSFSGPTFVGPPWGGGDVVPVDLDGDGRLDLVAHSTYDEPIAVVVNETPAGALTPSFRNVEGPPGGSDQSRLATADFNADGRMDLVLTRNPEVDNGLPPHDPQWARYRQIQADILLNTTPGAGATPSFSDPQAFVIAAKPDSSTWDAVTAVDVNGDGRPDLVNAYDVQGSPGDVAVRLNTTPAGAATVSFSAPRTFGAASPNALAAPDVNGDGRVDLVTASITGQTSVLLNTTPAGADAPSFSSAATFPDANAYEMAVADVDADGRPDLALPVNTGLAKVALNTTATGAGSPSFTGWASFDVGDLPAQMAAADLDGDSRPDLATANLNSDDVSVLVNATAVRATAPAFTGPSTLTAGRAAGDVAAADLNGDGRNDLVEANTYGGENPMLAIFLNTTPPPQLTLSPERTDFGTRAVATSSDVRTFTLTSTAGAEIPVEPALSGDTGDFAVTGDTCAGRIPGDGGCTISIRFTPTSAGPRTATLTVTTPARSPMTATLTGAGEAAPQPPVTPRPAPKDEPAAPILCGGRQLALYDLRRSGRRVVVAGVAAPTLIGRQVILRPDRGRASATAIVRPDATFEASLPAPPKRARGVKYVATSGTVSSGPFRLTRAARIVRTRTTSTDVRVTVTFGARRRGRATVFHQTTCTTRTPFATARVRKGRVTIRLPRPTGASGPAVTFYRVTLPLRRGRTYTLPIVIRR